MSCTFENKQYTPKSIKITDQFTIQVNLEIQNSLQEAEFSLQPNNNNNNSVSQYLLADNNNINSFFEQFPLTINISIYIDQNAENLNQASSISSQGSSVLTGGVLVSNPASAITMMRLLQSFEFFTYINVDTPQIVITFLRTFNFNIFKAIPSLLGDISINEDPYQCQLHPKLMELEVSCLGVNGSGFLYLYIFIFYIFKLILFLPLLVLEKLNKKKIIPTEDSGEQKPSGFLRFMRKINSKFNMVFYISFIRSLEIDLFFGSWLSPQSIKKLTLWSISSFFILLFFAFHNFFYCYFLLKYLVLFQVPKSQKVIGKEEQIQFRNNNRIMIGVFEDQIKESSTYGVLVLLAYSLRDMLIPMSLIYLVDYPLAQILAMIVFHSTIFAIIAGTLPYKTLAENIAELFNISIMIILTLIYLTLYFLTNILDSKQKNYFIGYPIILLIMIMAAANLLYCLISGVVHLVLMIKN